MPFFTRSRFAVTLALITVFLSTAVPAQAHGTYIGSGPVSGTTVSEVTSISFEFAEPIQPDYTEMSLMTSNGHRVELGPVSTNDAHTVITAQIPSGPLPDARYFAAFVIVFLDGIPLEDKANFIVSGSPASQPVAPEPPAEPAPNGSAPATGSTALPTTSAGAVAPSSSPTKSAKPEVSPTAQAREAGASQTSNSSAVLGIVLGATLVIGVSVTIVIVTRRRRRTST